MAQCPPPKYAPVCVSIGTKVVNGPTSSGPNPARTRKPIWGPNHARKKPKVKLGLKNYAMLPSCFDRGGVEDTRLEAKAKDTKKIRGQGQGQPFRGQTLSRPRTGMLEAKAKDQGHKAQVLSKKKKKRSSQKFFRRSPKKKKKKRSSQKFFRRSPLKDVFQKIFQALHKILTFQKIVLSSSRGQANFRGLEASRPRPRTWPSRPRTSKCVLEDVLEAKDVLEDSTSVFWLHFYALRTKSTSQARTNPKIFVNFGPEPGPNPTRKALTDLELWLGRNWSSYWKHFVITLNITYVTVPYNNVLCIYGVWFFAHSVEFSYRNV